MVNMNGIAEFRFGIEAAGNGSKHWESGRDGWWLGCCPDVHLRQGGVIHEMTIKAFTKAEVKP